MTTAHATKILKFFNFHQSTLCTVKNFFKKLFIIACKHSLLIQFCYYLCDTKFLNKNGNWGKSYDFELHKLFSDVDFLKFVKLNRMRWAGHFMRMECDRYTLKDFNTIPFQTTTKK